MPKNKYMINRTIKATKNHDGTYCSQERHMDDYEDLICEEHSHVSREIQGSQKDENWNKWEIYHTKA